MLLDLPDVPKSRSFWLYEDCGLRQRFSIPSRLWWKRMEKIQDRKCSSLQLRTTFQYLQLSVLLEFCCANRLLVGFPSNRHLVFNLLLSAKSVDTCFIFMLPTNDWPLLGYYASLYLKWVSFKQHRDGSCFFMHSDNLFYLVHLGHWHSERSFCHSWSIVYSINYYFLFVALVLCPYFCVQLLFCLSAVLITFFSPFLEY